jgi:hypothetical protein
LEQAIVECRGLTPLFAGVAGRDGAGVPPAGRQDARPWGGRQDACPTVQRVESRDRGWRQGGGRRGARERQARLVEEPFERRAGGGRNVHGT